MKASVAIEVAIGAVAILIVFGVFSVVMHFTG